MRVPKKNIHKVLSDVKSVRQKNNSTSPVNSPAPEVDFIAAETLSSQPYFQKSSSAGPIPEKFQFPKISRPASNSFGSLPRRSSSRRPSLASSYSRRSYLKFATTFIAGILLAIIILFGISVWRLKREAPASVSFILGQFMETARSFSEFNPAAAKKSLMVAGREIGSLRERVDSIGLAAAADLLSGFLPRFGEFTNAFSSLENLTSSAITFSSGLEDLKTNGLGYFTGQQGGELISLLKNVKSNVSAINRESSSLVQSSQNLSNNIPLNEYLSFQTDLLSLEDFLGGLISALDYPRDRHWLVAFQNASEIRPTGGFIGSFADLTINSGSLTDIKVTDIYDPDGQLDLKSVPPEPLQAITSNWGARDANWFFDFPDSASKFIYFLENSKIYSERGISFDGLIAINTNLFESILNIVGPINLPEYNLTITSENFLAEIQREIEIKRTKDKSQPKTILKDLTPLVIERLNRLSDSQKELLIEIVKSHIDSKDVVFYAKSPSLQSFFEKYEVAGRVYQLSPVFPGDYLAVVVSNIAGGKSDAYISQDISLKTEIGLDGVISNFLTIERTHSGADADDSWYQAANQAYLRVLTAPGSELLLTEGETAKNISSPLNYQSAGYQEDNLVVNLEENNLESGKTVFGRWLTTKSGQTKQLRFNYQNPTPLFLADGQTYQFIFDKQSGVNSELHLEIEAPPGFKWAEPNAFTYRYDADIAPKRLIQILTLKEI